MLSRFLQTIGSERVGFLVHVLNLTRCSRSLPANLTSPNSKATTVDIGFAYTALMSLLLCSTMSRRDIANSLDIAYTLFSLCDLITIEFRINLFTMLSNFLKLLLILLGFSYVLSVYAIPATRTKNLNGEDTSVVPLAQSALKLEDGEELMVKIHVEKEGLMERREDLETQDYGGTGANRDHDPKAPGLHG
ncbi:hypothetical protein VNO78_33318 [Psophocarpus tetragonolobus]|uniref:Uncharacterized protein n=1 Tax=Psophocarpus tetragonolobus TaxID=3891 RepID=A0AAN9P260_PSOTE